MKPITIVAFLLLAVPALQAEDRKFDPAALAEAVAPFVDDTTAVVAHLDLGQLAPEKLVERFAAVSGLEAKDVDGLFSEADRKRHRLLQGAGVHDVFVVFAMTDLFQGSALIMPLGDKVDAAVVTREMGPKFGGGGETVGKAFVAGSPATVARLKKIKAVNRPEVRDAFVQAGDGAVQVALLVPADLRRVLEELMPTLPPELGGGRMQVYTRGVRWAALAAQTEPKLKLRLNIICPDDTAATSLHDALEKILPALVKAAKDKELARVAGPLLPGLVPKVNGNRLELALDEKALGEMIRPNLPRARVSSERARSTNNLKQLLLAMHNYHDAHGQFPAAAGRPPGTDKDGPPVSWRVQLLPYLDQTDLYKQYRLDEPWDSAHNKKLIEKMPKVFDSTADRKLAAAGMTTYLAPRGKQTMFPADRGLRIADVLDGTANTIFLVDADDRKAVPWTRPADCDYDPAAPAAGLSLRFGDGYLVGFVDGSVHYLPRTLHADTLRGLFTRNGGEVLDYP